MKKSGILCGLVMSIGLLLTGCSNPFDYMPNLTEEESALISEYAAGILIKHDKYAGKLVDDAEIIAADEKEARLQASVEAFREMEKKKAEEEAQQEAEGEKEAGGNKNAEGEAEEVQTPFTGIADFCGADGFQIRYIGHSVCDSYPEEEGGEKVFAMDATAGNKLLVLKFIAENTGGEDRELDMLSKGVRFRIGVNGESEKSALSTLLLDDLSSYRDVVPAQTGVQLVLIREIPTEQAAAIQSISLSLINESENATTSLE